MRSGSAIEQYLGMLDELTGQQPKQIHQIIGGEDPPQLVVLSYADLPEEDHQTAFTFGLSSIEKAEWKLGRPELLISVKSLDPSWPLAMGDIAARRRNELLFECGTILDFGEPVSSESLMSCFLIFTNSLLDKDDSTMLLSDRTIHLVQLYPIHREEKQSIKVLGLERFFFEMGIDFYDVNRAPVVLKQ